MSAMRTLWSDPKFLQAIQKSAPAPAPVAAGTSNLAPWQGARQTAIRELKAFATKVAASKHRSAVGVLKEIQFIITNLPPNPAPNGIGKLEQFVRCNDTVTAAEEIPAHFHKLDIRKPLLEALESLKQ